jgi:hypothetical protein
VNKTWLVAITIVGVIAAAIFVLASGGPSGGSADKTADVALGAGDNPPGDTTGADIVEATARQEESGEIIFEVTMARAVEEATRKGLSFRWDITENGEGAWMVSADFKTGSTVSLKSLRTDYGASTIDDTLPGDISVEGSKLVVTIRGGEIEGWPDAFEWLVTSTLDADEADPASAVATDSAPDSGPGALP